MGSVGDRKSQLIREIDELRNEIVDLATDRDIYWKVQHEVIQKNARLLITTSAFFDMLNNSYAHATAVRVRRLVDQRSRTLSLRRLIQDLGRCPELFLEKFSKEDLRADMALLDATCKKVKCYVDQFVAHHDRNGSAAIPTHKELNEAVDTIVSVYRRYYGLLKNTDIDPLLHYVVEPLAIFTFPWVNASTDQKHASAYSAFSVAPRDE